MNIFDTLMHYGSFAMAFYAFYVVTSSLLFGYYLWHRVYRVADADAIATPRKLRGPNSRIR